MAFQIGEIKIAGTIDGLSFYNSEFGWLVRRKGGPSRKQFKNSPNFQRARENSSEFTKCSRAASMIKKLVVKHTAKENKTLYHRLVKLMCLLSKEDKRSPRGQRDPLKALHNTQAIPHLTNFEICAGLSLYDVLITTRYIKEPVRIKKRIKQKYSYRTPNTNFPNRFRPHKILLRNSYGFKRRPKKASKANEHFGGLGLFWEASAWALRLREMARSS